MRKSHTKKYTYLLYAIIVLFGLILLTVAVDINAGPLIKDIAVSQGKRIISQEVNSAIIEAVSSSPSDSASEYVTVKYTNSGSISSVETNTAEISRLQSIIAVEVNNRLKENSNNKVKIPLGTFTGMSILNGKGTDIEFDVISSGNADVQIESNFISSGINQTLHEIKITVSSEMYVSVPFNSISFPIEETYLICDTVIVGDIPDSYTYVVGDERDNTSKLFDYR